MRRELRKTTLLLGFALFAGVVALYLPSTRNDFLYDDRLLILKQAPLRSAGDVAKLFTERYYTGLPNYRPVTAGSFAVQKTLHGDVPFPFHLFNVLAAGLVAVVVHRLLRSPAFGLRPATAIVATALFLAHPVISSCVDPVSGRDTLLAIGLVAGSVLAFLRRTPARIAAGLVLVAVGLLTKEAAIV